MSKDPIFSTYDAGMDPVAEGTDPDDAVVVLRCRWKLPFLLTYWWQLRNCGPNL